MTSAVGPLVAAVRAADPAAVERLLGAEPRLACATVAADPAEADPQGTTPLHLAMPGDGRPLRPEQVAVARALLARGADPNAVGNGPNHGRCAPLSLAAWGGHVVLVELLLAHGARPDGAPGTADAHTPIRTAARHGHGEAVAALMAAGASHTLLEPLLAGLAGPVGRHLEAHPAAANAPVQGALHGAPPLHAALQTGPGSSLVPLLLEHGADPCGRDGLGRRPLLCAVEEGRREAVAVLRGRSGDLDLFEAAGLGDAARVEALLAADPARSRALARQAQPDGTTALFHAVLAGSPEIATCLLDAGADPAPRSSRFWACLTPLHLALQRRARELAQLLLARGADPDACGTGDLYQPSPLQAAARWGTVSDVALLLDAGADPYGGAGRRDGADPGVLPWVAGTGQVEVLRLLLDRGLDLKDPRGAGVLHLAAARGHLGVLDLLLAHGARVDARGPDGATALESALQQGQEAAAKLLRAAELPRAAEGRRAAGAAESAKGGKE